MGEGPGIEQARARATANIPPDVTNIKQKLASAEESFGKTLSANGTAKSRMEFLMGDVEGNRESTEPAEGAGNIDAGVAAETEKIRGLLLASIVGTEGLPPLSHSVTTRLG